MSLPEIKPRPEPWLDGCVMRFKRSLHRLVTAALVCPLAGCVDIDPGPPLSGEQFTFQEDADPAIAGLPFVEKELLVQPYPGADAQSLLELYAQAGVVVVDELPDIELAVLEVPDGDLVGAGAELSDSGLIETVQKNYIFEAQALPDDPLFGGQPHLRQIFAPEAWELTVGHENIIIAVVDTGVDADHPDLEEKVIDGWNFFDDSPDYSDVAGHGTQVAGVAAAMTDNAIGVAGVAWESPILAVRVTDDRGRATGRHIAAGILWAAAHDASVINVSFAPLWSDRVVRAAAQTAFHRGCLVVISAGNAGGSTKAPGYPEALFVGAIDGNQRIAFFSDSGPFVDLVAPGTGVRTTRMGAGYGFANGTSFSAPIVSGVAALAWSINPDLRPASIMNAVLGSAVDLGSPGKDSIYGLGALDAAAAVAQAEMKTYLPDNAPPSLTITRPSDGARLSGRTTAMVTARDDHGVADVVLYIDDLPHATDTRSPFWFVIDPSLFPPGAHELSFIATDFAGNASETESIEVTFAASSALSRYASEITFKSPTDRATVSRDVTIQATVSDPDGLALVEWLVDGISLLVTPVAGQSTGVSLLWPTSGALPGEHIVTLVVTDITGRQTSAALHLFTR